MTKIIPTTAIAAALLALAAPGIASAADPAFRATGGNPITGRIVPGDDQHLGNR